MSIWLRAPLLRLCIFFISGILIRELFLSNPLAPQLLLIGLLALATACFINTSYPRRQINGLATCLTLMLAGYAVAEFHHSRDEAQRYRGSLDDDTYLLGEVIQSPIQKKRSVQTHLLVQRVWEDDKWISSPGKILCYFQADTLNQKALPVIGSEILLHGKVQKIGPPLNPGAFDYQKFMSRRGIEHQIYCRAEDWMVHKGAEKTSLSTRLGRLRSILLTSIQTRLDPREFGVISALSLGEKNFLDKETADGYKSAGTMHLLAVSGLHVGLIYVVLVRILSFMQRSRWLRLISTALIILLLWGYAGLAGSSPSVMRAATMFTFLSFGGLYSRKPNSYNLLALSAICLLVINPQLIYEVGFQLSYSAVVAILFFQPMIERWWTPPNRVLTYFWQLATVSLAAQIGTFPISLFYFHSFPTYFLLANIFVIPLATFTLYASILFYCLHWIPGLESILGWLVQKLCWLLNEFVALTRHLPLNQIESIHINALEVIAILVFFYAVFSFRACTRITWLRTCFYSVLLFSLSSATVSWQVIKQQVLVIHHVRGQSAMSIITGGEVQLYVSSESDEPSSAVAYATEGMYSDRRCTLAKVQSLTFDDPLYHEVRTGNLKIVLVGVAWDSRAVPGDQQVIWIMDEPKINWELWRNLKPDQLILADGSCSGYWVSKNRKAAQKVGLNLQSTWETGAWECSSFEPEAEGEHNPRILPIVSAQ